MAAKMRTYLSGYQNLRKKIKYAELEPNFNNLRTKNAEPEPNINTGNQIKQKLIFFTKTAELEPKLKN